jgi:hypothetical protein
MCAAAKSCHSLCMVANHWEIMYQQVITIYKIQGTGHANLHFLDLCHTTVSTISILSNGIETS